MQLKTGEKIRNRRLELNMTMEDLGRAVGVGRSAINKYEKGLIDITSERVKAIAKALDVPAGFLMDDLEETPRTVEAKLLARGVDKMPAAQREAIMNMMAGLYPGLFEKGTDEDDA